MIAPLLVNNSAIQAWVRETDSLGLAQTVLLDVETSEEAAQIAAMEYPMAAEQTATLVDLLNDELVRSQEAVTDDQDSPAGNYELLVDRAHVIQGLQAFRVPRKLRSGVRAVLGFDGSYLTVEAFDQMFVARATGVWPGNARVSATLIAVLKQAPPAGDPLLVRCDGERVSIGSMRVDCAWQPVSAALTSAPAASDWIAALGLSYSTARGRIVTGGSAKEVRDAERKLSQLIARVAKALAPLGVSAEDVRSLVETRLRERYLVSKAGIAPGSEWDS